MFAAQISNRHVGLSLLQLTHNLSAAVFQLLRRKLFIRLFEKFLLSKASSFREDYPAKIFESISLCSLAKAAR